MKKIIFLLMMMCIIFTGCKKDKAESELSIENDSIQTEIHSEAERLSTTTTALTAETVNTDTSVSSQTSSSTSQTLTTSVTTATTEVSLDVGDALQKAVIDEEEKAAIEAVQPSEQLIYYKNPTLDFDSEAYANLNIMDAPSGGLTSANGSNIHQYFFESKPMSGTDILYLQKACEGYSGVAFDSNQVKSFTGDSLENSELLTYQNDSAYLELYRSGELKMYNPEHVAQILGQEIKAGWIPDIHSKSRFPIWTFQTWKSRNPDDGFPNQDELSYFLNGEIVSVAEACSFLFEYFMQSIEAGWISSLYEVEAFTPVSVEVIEYENGSYGYYFTIQLHTAVTLLPVDYTDKTAYLNPDRAVKGQYIQVLMLSKDSVDYISLPPTMTKSPDYTQTVSGTYCTLSEACEILSEYLSSGHVYDVKNIYIQYETVYLNEGIVQSPMWHFEVTSLVGAEGVQYSMLYADIDLETKELYVSYR